MKIILFQTKPWKTKAFNRLQKKHQVITTKKPLSKETIEEFKDADIISISVYPELTKEILTQFEHLKYITTRSTGIEHIDIDYCTEQEIAVSNIPTYSDNTVAEHVFALLLTISRNMFESIQRTRTGNFSLKGLRGFDLKRKIIGVIGTGHIGTQVIRIARGFDMEVLAYDVNPQKKLANKMEFQYVSMNELLSNSNIITLHVPENKKTVHLISTNEFSMMKNGVILINTSRGNIVDIQALLKAMESKKVGAVGFDVLPEEPTIREEVELMRSVYEHDHDLEDLLADQVLMRLSNVYITPHNAFNTYEAVQRIRDTTLSNIESFMNHSPENLVTK